MACCECTVQNRHYDCLECKHKELVCVFFSVCYVAYVYLCVGGGSGEIKRKTETDLGAGVFWWERQHTAKNSTALGDNNIPECFGSGEEGEGRRKTQQRGGRRGLGCHPYNLKTLMTHARGND